MFGLLASLLLKEHCVTHANQPVRLFEFCHIEFQVPLAAVKGRLASKEILCYDVVMDGRPMYLGHS